MSQQNNPKLLLAGLLHREQQQQQEEWVFDIKAYTEITQWVCGKHWMHVPETRTMCVCACHGSQSHSRYGLPNSLFFNAISAATKTTTTSNNPQNKLSKRNNSPSNCIPSSYPTSSNYATFCVEFIQVAPSLFFHRQLTFTSNTCETFALERSARKQMWKTLTPWLPFRNLNVLRALSSCMSCARGWKQTPQISSNWTMILTTSLYYVGLPLHPIYHGSYDIFTTSWSCSLSYRFASSLIFGSLLW